VRAALKAIWGQVEPFAEPAWHQVQKFWDPVWDALRPYVGESLHKLNEQLKNHEPLALVALSAIASLVILKLYGTFRKITNFFLLGLLLAYLWPYIAQHIKQG
jgi:hypothetical protein